MVGCIYIKESHQQTLFKIISSDFVMDTVNSTLTSRDRWEVKRGEIAALFFHSLQRIKEVVRYFL